MNSNIVNQICELFGFKKVTWINQLGGFSALNFEIEADDKRLVLKKYRSLNINKVNQMERISIFLNKHQLPTFPAILTKHNKAHFLIDEQIYALFPKTEGIVLHEPSLSQPVLFEIASLLANLHQLNPSTLNLDPFEPRILNRKVIAEYAKQTLNKIKENPISIDIDQLTRALIKTKLHALDHVISLDLFKPYLKSNNFVHGDFHNENILFNQNQNTIVRLLDFEETHLGHRIEDVMHFILLACCNSGYEKPNLKKAQFFFQAYDSISPLTTAEITFGVHYELFKQFSSFFLEQELYNTRNLFLAKLIERDLKKVHYFKENIETFIKNLS